ncbi:MAG: prepilin-type N-terminal cleavage/methylation domain-containing protein [Candidatus Omnitrophica bacterium]|nr:prepilin-type N-terminal cleavage/methylation domain-containing protein [Candidatus Omnitrophota bacterium]
MAKQGFTLVEIVVVVVIVGILTTIGFPVYHNIVENSKAKVCETNLKTLQTSLDIYALDNDTMPASLSQLPQKYIRMAYKQVLSGKDAWKIKLAFIIVDWKEHGIAHAAFLKDDVARGNITLVTCPMDLTGPSKGGISYGVNASLANMSSIDYRKLPPATVLIGDSDSATFSGVDGLARRHKQYSFFSPQPYYQAVTKEGSLVTNLSSAPAGSNSSGGSGDCQAKKKQCMDNCTTSTCRQGCIDLFQDCK